MKSGTVSTSATSVFTVSLSLSRSLNVMNLYSLATALSDKTNENVLPGAVSRFRFTLTLPGSPATNADPLANTVPYQFCPLPCGISKQSSFLTPVIEKLNTGLWKLSCFNQPDIYP